MSVEGLDEIWFYDKERDKNGGLEIYFSFIYINSEVTF